MKQLDYNGKYRAQESGNTVKREKRRENRMRQHIPKQENSVAEMENAVLEKKAKTRNEM